MSVGFSPADLKAHFRGANTLTLTGDAPAFCLSGLDGEGAELLRSSGKLNPKAVKRVIDRILLPLGKVLKGISSANIADITILGTEEESGRFQLISSKHDLTLTVHAGTVITRTGDLIGALSEPNQDVIEFQPNQWVVLSDIAAAPVLSSNSIGSSFSLPTAEIGNKNLKISGENLAIAEDETTSGLAVCSTTSHLVVF